MVGFEIKIAIDNPGVERDGTGWNGTVRIAYQSIGQVISKDLGVFSLRSTVNGSTQDRHGHGPIRAKSIIGQR